MAVFQPMRVATVPGCVLLLAGIGTAAISVHLQYLTSRQISRQSAQQMHTIDGLTNEKCSDAAARFGDSHWQHLEWLVGSMATVHWTGYLASYAAGTSSKLTLLVSALGILGLQYGLALSDWKWTKWFDSLALHLYAIIRRLPYHASCPILKIENGSQVPSSDNFSLQHEKLTNDLPATIASAETAVEASGQQLRSTSVGLDPHGHLYMAGWIQFSLELNQKNERISIGFCPAIIGSIEVELECEPEDVSASTVQQTPTGMRVEVKRSRADSELKGILHWQCTECSKQLNLVDFPANRSNPLP